VSRPRPQPPHPDLVRRPSGGFGWLEQRLLLDGWLRELGPKATAVLVLLALAADRNGASFFGRLRMAGALGLSCEDVDLALGRLTELGLVAHRPWRAGTRDGVWQLLGVPVKDGARSRSAVSIQEIMARLGLSPPAANAKCRRQIVPPEKCGS
jgi:hypothetical protein